MVGESKAIRDVKIGAYAGRQIALPRQGKGKKREWISSEESRAEVQRMRHASDALLTALANPRDDPLLTDRSGLPRRRKLLRVILDSQLKLSPKSRIVKRPTRTCSFFTGASLKSPKVRKLQEAGVELIRATALADKLI